MSYKDIYQNLLNATKPQLSLLASDEVVVAIL